MFVEEEIAKLQVAVNDVGIVHIANCLNNLQHEEACLFFGETFATFDHFIHTLIMTKFK
jgi:hypothetical protein